MSITSYSELFTDLKGDIQLEKGQRTGSRSFQLFSSIINENPETVYSYGSLPALGSGFPGDSGCLLKKKSAVMDASGDRTRWIVHCDYDSILPNPEQTNKDPTARNPKWTFGVAKYMKPLQYDRLGVPFMNSACMPFDPPYEIEESRPTIEIEIAKATLDYNFVTSICGCLNNDTWNGFTRWQVKCESATATQNWENNIFYWQYKYNLTISAPEAWQPIKILDQGMYIRNCSGSGSGSFPSSEATADPSSAGNYDSTSPGRGDPNAPPVYPQCGCTGTLQIIRDKGQPINAPVLLNGQGQQTTTPTYLWFYPYKEIDFSGIP